jgi:hypothetical protein
LDLAGFLLRGHRASRNGRNILSHKSGFVSN